jgi:hypothetical protein
MLYPEEMVLSIPVNGPDSIVGVIKGIPVFVGLNQFLSLSTASKDRSMVSPFSSRST